MADEDTTVQTPPEGEEDPPKKEEEESEKAESEKADEAGEEATADEAKEPEEEDGKKDGEDESPKENEAEEVAEETIVESKAEEVQDDAASAPKEEEEEAAKEPEKEDPLCPERVKAVFDVFQKDDSVEVSEIGSMIRSLGFNPLDEEVDEIVKPLTEDSVTSIDFEKFKALVEAEGEKRKDIDEDQRFKDAFEIFDKEKTGKISKGELKEVLTTMGNMKLSEEEADDVIEKLEFDDDENISHESIIQLLRS